MRRLFPFFVLLFSPLAAHAQEIETKRDLVFGKGGDQSLRLDLLRPQILPKTALPVVIFIHGGAWQTGSHHKYPPLLAVLVKRGFAVASIQFRSLEDALFPAQIEDCKCAVRFLRANAKSYSLDANKIGVFGVSTGGHLAALLGTSGDAKNLEGKGGWNGVSSRVQAVAEIAGPSDFLALAHSKRGRIGEVVRALLGGTPASRLELAQNGSPVFWASKDDPPFLILHGDADSFVPIDQSERLFQALKKAGASVTFRVFSGAEHGLRDHWDGASKEITKFFEEDLK